MSEHNTNRSDERPVGELVKELSQQTSLLVRQEVELAKVELAEKGKQVGIGAGMFGGAGVTGFYAVGVLLAFLILLLIEIGLAPWLSALIVFVVLAAIAGVLALQGKNKVQKGAPPVPEQAVESVKQDVDTVKTRAQEGRR